MSSSSENICPQCDCPQWLMSHPDTGLRDYEFTFHINDKSYEFTFHINAQFNQLFTHSDSKLNLSIPMDIVYIFNSDTLQVFLKNNESCNTRLQFQDYLNIAKIYLNIAWTHTAFHAWISQFLICVSVCMCFLMVLF